MSDAQVGQISHPPDAAASQAADGKTLLEHSGWLDRIKHSAATVGHNASELMHKGIETGKKIASDPKTQKVAREVGHDVAQAGREVVEDHAKKVQGVANSARHGDLGGAAAQALPLVGEALTPHLTAARILKDKGAEIAEKHASPQMRSEIERRNAESNQKAQSHSRYIPPLLNEGASSESTKH